MCTLLLFLFFFTTTAQESNENLHDVLGYGFDIRNVDALNWVNSSKGKKLISTTSSTAIINDKTEVTHHFVTNPYEFEKKVLRSDRVSSPFQAQKSTAFHQVWNKEDHHNVLVVYTEKRLPLTSKHLENVTTKSLDSALVEDFRRVGRDITPEGFINRYGTHYAQKVVYGGVFLKRNLISNDDFIYSPYDSDEFTQRVIEDITASNAHQTDVDPYINSGKSNSFTIGGNVNASSYVEWIPSVQAQTAPIDVTLQTYSHLFRSLNIPDLADKDINIKLIDSVTEIATKKAQMSTQRNQENDFFKKYSLRFQQSLTSLIKKRSGSQSDNEVAYTGDLFFGGFSKDEAILKTEPLIDIGGIRLETLITDERVNLNKNIEFIVSPADIKEGYVSIWDDTKKLVKSKERTRLRVSGPEEAKTRFREALVRNVSKNVEITTIDGDLYEVGYTLALIKEKKILENNVQSYNSAMQTQLVSAAATGDIELLETLFENNNYRRIQGLIKSVITTKQSPEILNLILDNGVEPKVEDLDLLFEKDFYDEKKILTLLERKAPFKNNMIYKAVAFKSDNIIYALLREGAEPRNNDLAFALKKQHYPTIKALMSVEFEAFEASENELLLAVENNDEDLAKKFIALGATADSYILEKALNQNNDDLYNVIVPITEASNESLVVAAKADNTDLFKYFVDKNARVNDNRSIEIATDNNNIQILDLALKNGGEPTNALSYAIKKENDPAIRITLENKAQPDEVFTYAAQREDAQLFNDALLLFGGTPTVALNAAIKETQVLFAQSIIKNKRADIDLNDVISLAVSTENLEMIKLLVENDASPSQGITEAVRIENEPITSYLISQGAETLDPSLIQEAVKKQNLSLSKILIEQGNSDVNKAIVDASNTGNLEITQYLLEKGASTNKALDAAMETKNEDIILLLLEKNTDSLKPEFLYSASRKGNLKVARKLLENGLNPTGAIEDALRYKQIEILKILIEFGGIPAQEQLNTAIKYNVIEALPMLLEQDSINVNAPFEDDSYAIHAVFKTLDKNDQEMVTILVDNGGNLNIQNKAGYTVLHQLASQQAEVLPLLEYLLERGADSSIRDKTGNLASDYATDKKIKSVLKKNR